MRNKHSLIALIAGLAFVLVATGCSSSGSEDPAASKAPAPPAGAIADPKGSPAAQSDLK